MGPSIKLYEKSTGKKGDVTEAQVHTLIGLAWIAINKPNYALANGRLAQKNARNEKDQYLAAALLAASMYSKKWYKMASDESTRAETIITNHNLSQRYKNSLQLVYLASTMLAVKEKDFNQAAVSFSNFSEITGREDLAELSGAISSIKAGNVEYGIRILKRFRESRNLSSKDKDYLNKLIDGVLSGDTNKSALSALGLAHFATFYYIETHPLFILATEKLPGPIRKQLR